MKARKTETVYLPIPDQQEIKIDYNQVPDIEWKQLCAIILPAARKFFEDPANRASADAARKAAKDLKGSESQ